MKLANFVPMLSFKTVLKGMGLFGPDKPTMMFSLYHMLAPFISELHIFLGPSSFKVEISRMKYLVSELTAGPKFTFAFVLAAFHF